MSDEYHMGRGVKFIFQVKPVVPNQAVVQVREGIIKDSGISAFFDCVDVKIKDEDDETSLLIVFCPFAKFEVETAHRVHMYKELYAQFTGIVERNFNEINHKCAVTVFEVLERKEPPEEKNEFMKQFTEKELENITGQ